MKILTALFSGLLILSGCAAGNLAVDKQKTAISTITIIKHGGDNRIIEMSGVRSVEIIVPAGVEVTVDHF